MSVRHPRDRAAPATLASHRQTLHPRQTHYFRGQSRGWRSPRQAVSSSCWRRMP